MYPLVIIDNFYDDPDAIVNIAEKQEYSSSPDGRWPGKRSSGMWNFDRSLYVYTCEKILKVFSDNLPSYWNFETYFQKITPFQDPFNTGWVHPDRGVGHFGGVIFMNKNPDENTGLNIYRAKNGYYHEHEEDMLVKQKLYSGENVSPDQYVNSYNRLHSQYECTIEIKNVYNRMVLFNNQTLHGVQSFGHSQDRLTIPFFCLDLTNFKVPLYR